MASLRLIRLKNRRDFVRLTRSGSAWRTRSLVLQMLPAPDAQTDAVPADACRVGFTATKRLGNAVMRNRAKRRLRAAATQILPVYGHAGCDYVLIARASCLRAPYDSLCQDLVHALKKVHVSC